MTDDTIASEVLSASLGGAISASILYPLEVLKTRMQALDEHDKDKDKGMWEYATTLYQQHGAGIYLQGIETSAIQSAMEKAFYFFAYTALKQMYTVVTLSSSMNATTNLALGCLAEWAHLPITMPIDCLTTEIQTSTSKQNAVALMCTILQKGNMYKGIQAYYVLCFKPALQYTVFEQVKQVVLKGRTKKSLSAGEAFLLGMVARTIATIAVFPFLRAKVVMQTRKKKESSSDDGDDDIENNDNQGTSIMSMLWEMYQTDGVGGLYQGLGPELTRGVFSAALMLMIKEQINGGVKTMLYGEKQQKVRR
mmetsp:Transcript_1096/g.2578  ORF Transcript_1096/g.2578 Transcript_1096/m.2578 type:complete len:308 (+) Transcript_1096:348-1271(+)|eukprot:CAMPEP_0119549300 /NCGR_PEP_ID=MMETSP1352-20130426/3045_1 /TAXON_ID=265584 /ORGANISM="Stauroneis constricta, Strain CCMP1120" /LENGTH=307 /DNA_ID=CAMNT_0007594833 /DNA_START=281 /DNA_END=1204 /DNA_ORIENTATION=-